MSTNLEPLKGKVALVTGASRGIGKAVALRLAKGGAKVVVNYSNSSKAAQEVVDEIVKGGGAAVAVQAQVNDPSQVKSMFEKAIEVFGTVDILINNAGITKDNLAIRMKDEEFDSVIDTNLKGVFYCLREAGKIMMKNRYGKIVNLTSVVGFSGNPGQINYVASKSAVFGMTKTLAMELGVRGVRVNAVAPGFIQTDMTDSLKENIKQGLIDKTLLKSLGTVDDVASSVYFLSIPESDYITGQVIHVNGGLYL